MTADIWDGVADGLTELAGAGDGVGADEPHRARLEFQSIAELCAEVDAMGPRRYLVRGLWPHGAYGVHAAEPKAGKTWNGFDLAVSVAAGRPFLGEFEVDTPGSVVVFAGEGGKGSVVRRLRAVAAAHGVELETLPITVCCRAPHLSDVMVRSEFRSRLATDRPVLVVLDPLYLAARGAKLGDVYAMGELLEGPQHDCELVGASLLVVTHFNRKEGRGASRITGAGPAEWGRVLLSTTVLSRRTDPVTSATTVVTETDVLGGEVADQAFRVRRTVVADDPADLDSPLRYEVEVLPADDQAVVDDGLRPAERKVLTALTAAAGDLTVQQIGDAIATEHGTGLRRPTIAKALGELLTRGLVDQLETGSGAPGRWLARGCA